MINKDKQYRTRDGREVRIYATDGSYPYVVHGAIKNENGEWQPSNWLNQGGATIVTSNVNDLIEVKPRINRTVWLNVYDNEVIHGGWRTKEDADKMTHCNRIACIKFDLNFEEGEGL